MSSSAGANKIIAMQLEPGALLSDELRGAGERFSFPCGGRGTCGKCRAQVEGALQPPTAVERHHLTAAELNAGWRLLCQCRASGGEIRIKNISPQSEAAVLVTGVRHDFQAAESTLQRQKISIAPAAAASGSQWERLSPAPHALSLSVLRRLLTMAPAAAEELEIITYAGEAVRLRKDFTTPLDLYGIAVDIGTTTMVAYLVDLDTGEIVDSLPRTNPQTDHGADVMSRIEAAATPPGLQLLHRRLIETIDEMIRSLQQTHNIAPEDIIAVVPVGNTAMHHFFFGLSPVSLGQSPYLPAYRGEILSNARALGLDACPQASIWSAPLLGGFVGADAVAAAVAGQLCRDEQPRLLVDLGTNGEIILAAGDKIWACSAAAGPALEGVQIKHGMRAEEGAIAAVKLTPDDINLTIIGGGEARGLCGSGLVDLVSEFVRLDIIDESGLFRDAASLEKAGLSGLAPRVKESPSGRSFILCREPHFIEFTQADIRQVQLAKAAIRAAIEVCCQQAGISTAALDSLLLAGAFGTHIDKQSAVRIGLLPPVPSARIHALGNAAGIGAVLSLTTETARQACRALVQKAQHIDLSADLSFQERFVDGMFFTKQEGL